MEDIAADIMMKEEPLPPRRQRRRLVSRAALQRLAADVGARLPVSAYEEEVDDIESFVRDVVAHSVMAGDCTGRKSVGRAQIQYALRVQGAPAPPEVLKLSDTELRRMRRCNPRAPAMTRRPSALSVEIPEASFAKLLSRTSAALDDGDGRRRPVRFSAAARRVLHAAVETRSAQRFKHLRDGGDANNKKDAATTPAVETLLPGVARVLEACGADPRTAAAAAVSFERMCSALESLLDIGGCVTITAAHVSVAMASVGIPVVEEEEDGATKEAAAALGRAVRGRLPDRRFQAGAVALIASSLLAECRSCAPP